MVWKSNFDSFADARDNDLVRGSTQSIHTIHTETAHRHPSSSPVNHPMVYPTGSHTTHKASSGLVGKPEIIQVGPPIISEKVICF